MTLSTAQGVYTLAALATVAGLWASFITVGSATRGAEWALKTLPVWFRVGIVFGALGLVAVVIVSPIWVGFGLAYLAGVVAWTARTVAGGLEKLKEAGAYETLPAARQAALIRRVSFWLLVVAALGAAVVVIDVESRGGVALWDLVLVGVLAIAGVLYRRRAAAMEGAAVE
ncbi:MAG: hypothetical protein HKN95_00755 [Acidimicrobiia bacterium]|nr:hypothetical protein [Acidimicrobiia bacterium]